ncbi:hypothetical protein ON010_g742 [Phytophthora cinnamomi]|nr:hypothetical protein ON010_g742 [Phytophthora cinnamomi]
MDSYVARRGVRLSRAALIPDVRFELSTYGDANATKDFRFDVNGVKLMSNLFALSATVITEEGDRCFQEEAQAIMLHQLSYLRRFLDTTNKFGRSLSALSRIFLWVIDYVDQRYKERKYFNLKVVQAKMNDYCSVIERRSSVSGAFVSPTERKCSDNYKVGTSMFTVYYFKTASASTSSFHTKVGGRHGRVCWEWTSAIFRQAQHL